MTRTAQSAAEGRKRATARWRRIGPPAVVLVAVASLVADCGGGSHAATPASQDSTSSQNGTSVPSPARQSGIPFVSCVRAHGVPDFPGSAVSANDGHFALHIPGYLKAEPRFQSALRACQKDLPGGGSVAKTKHVNIQQELRFARCMRSHGITDFPDPLPSGGWDLPGDTNSPQFGAAAHACRSTGIHWNGAP